MKLNLKRPLVVFDLETTGLDIATDRIVEISMVKVFPDGTNEVKTRRLNPTIPIPPEVSAIHHITDEDVKDEPTFRQVAKSLAQFIEGCDLAGYNSNRFDLPLLAEEFIRAGVDVNLRKARFVDASTIFRKNEPRTLTAAYKFYCDKELGDAAHGAAADTMATYEVLMSQLDRYPELQNDIQFLSEYSTEQQFADFAGRIGYDASGDEIFTFGKHKGRKVKDVFRTEPSFYSWMMNASFPEYTKKVLTELYVKYTKA